MVARLVECEVRSSRKRMLVNREMRLRGITKSGIKLKRRFWDLQYPVL